MLQKKKIVMQEAMHLEKGCVWPKLEKACAKAELRQATEQEDGNNAEIVVRKEEALGVQEAMHVEKRCVWPKHEKACAKAELR